MHNLEPDELHVMHLGTSSWMAGSILWVLCYLCLPSTPEENMKNIWKVIVDTYRTSDAKTQYSNLTLSSFCDPKKPKAEYPKLKGRGAEVKDLMPCLLAVWDAFSDSITYEYDIVRSMLVHQVELQRLLSEYSTDLFLTVPASTSVQMHVDQILHCYTHLANRADRVAGDEGLLWNVTPKFHWWWHWARRAIFLNPRKGNCFIDEDFVGGIKEIVARSTSGTTMELVPGKVMEKYQWHQHFCNIGA